jgi:hypothetical protein
MFVGLTIGVILIIGGLTFFPAVALGPLVEAFSHRFWGPPAALGPMFQHLSIGRL